jgi:hypothetical protein
MLDVLIKVIGQVLPGILSSNGVKNVDLAKINADLTKELAQIDLTRLQSEISNLDKQAEINKVLAETGKLGWRNALCWVLTIGVALQITFVQNILVTLGVLTAYALGLTHEEIQAIVAFYPTATQMDLVGMLMGLCGLYGWRGYEKIQLTKQLK